MLFRLGTALVLIGLLAACGASPTPAAQPTAISNAPSEDEVNTQSDETSQVDVVAVVNGEGVTRERFTQALTRRASGVDAADPEALEAAVLDTLINDLLIEQEAERRGVTVTDAELDEEITILREEAAAVGWETWLSENGYPSEAVFREDLRVQLIGLKMRDLVVSDLDSENQRLVHARHILLDSEQEALDVRNLLVNGESFVTLAAQFSKDVTTKDQGGDLGWFAQEELLEPRVAEAAFNQDEGAISQPIATRLGYHIVQTLGFDELPLPPDKQAQIAAVVFDEWLTTLYDSAIIEIYR